MTNAYARIADRKKRAAKERRLRRGLIAKAIVCVAVIALLIVLIAVSRNPDNAEWMTRRLTLNWVAFFGTISGVFAPMSIFELGCIVMVAWAIFALIRTIVLLTRRQGKRALNQVLAIVVAALIIGTVYYGTAGVAYNRHEPPVPLAQNEDIKKEEVRELYFAYQKDMEHTIARIETAEDGGSVCPYTFDELSELIRKEFAKLDADYFGTYTPRAKKVLNGWFMSNMRVQGITFVPTGEPNINRRIPMSDVPYTMAHEMAHTHGVMYEADANFVAKYVLLNSDDPYLHYCGLRELSFYDLLEYSNNGDLLDADESDEESSDMMFHDMIRSINFWSKYRLFGDIGAFFNDLYLKIVGQDNGTGGYYDPGTSGGDVIGETPDGDPVYDDNTQYNRVSRMIYAYYRDKSNR